MAEAGQVRNSVARESRRASSKRVSKAVSKRASSRRSTSKDSSISHQSTSRRSSSRRSVNKKQNESGQNIGKKLWDGYLGPVIASCYTFSALVWSFLLAYVGQFFINKYDETKEKKHRMTKSESAVTHGELFHGLISSLMMEANPFWSRTVTSDVPIDELPTCVFMANHISFADPFVLCGAVPECKAVGMASLWDIPIVGDVVRNNGDMAVFFEKKDDGRWGTIDGSKDKLISDAATYLNDGVPVVVFPEGSISKDGKLQELKVGFFKVAMEAGVPIVPVASWGSQKAWPAGKPNALGQSVPKYLLNAADINLHIGTPISTTDGKSLQELMDEVFTQIDTMTKALPGYSLKNFGE